MLNIPRITKQLALEEYDKEYAGLALRVWVNLSRRHAVAYGDMARRTLEALEALKGGAAEGPEGDARQRLSELPPETAEALQAEGTEWWAEVWGWPVEDVREFYENAPAELWAWMTNKSHELIRAYREERAGPNRNGGSEPG